jgi:hypothetical protein
MSACRDDFLGHSFEMVAWLPVALTTVAICSPLGKLAQKP